MGYRIDGRGRPLVLIMGYSGSMDAWQPSFVDALAKDHRVVIFDNAGVGKTQALPSPLSITAMADQTSALIAALQLGPSDVLGWSMGGMIAQALAVRHPDQLRRLVLCATLPGNGQAVPPSASAVAALTGGNPSAVVSVLFPADHSAERQAYIAAITGFPHFYGATATTITAQRAALGSWFAGKEPAGSRIGTLSIPTLVADGSLDALIPVANDHILAATIPSAKLVLYPDAGHAFLFQDQADFLARIGQFLG